MIQLRPYQEHAVGLVHDAWARVQTVLLVLPTGAGKTVTFASIIHDHNGYSAAIVHRKEIVAQISEALAKLEVPHRIIGPDKLVTRCRRKHLRKFGKSFVDQHARCGVVSVQTLTSRSSEKDRELQRWWGQVSLRVYDEGHHYMEKGFWAKAVQNQLSPAVKILMVTATPERADGLGLGEGWGGFAQEMIIPTDPETGAVIDTRWLIERGYLSDYVWHAPPTQLDVSDIPVTASGEFNAKALRARVVESHLVGDVVAQYRKFANGTQAICFADSVATAAEFEAAFIAAGYTAKALSGETEDGERDRAIDDYADGKTQVLINVDLFDEGFDVPATVTVILARPTESLAKFLQQVGRGLRVMEGKERAIILDPVRNWERHGLPRWPRVWSLEGKTKGQRKAQDTVPQRTCLADMCYQPYPAYLKACPYCGAVPEIKDRSGPEHVDGEIQMLDESAFEHLFAQYRAANMSADEYALDLVARRVPPLGRGQAMRRHEAVLYRRGALKELVAWWWGCQPEDRTEAEKQRRFYHRFGVDIMTAFTLDEAGTDELCARIAQKFGADIVDTV